jgi:hypothetical protein
MPGIQVCPNCKSRLRIPESVTTPAVTCPRCLKSVPNPAADVFAAEPVVAADPPSAAAFPCKGCGKPIFPHYHYCPYCNLGLHGKRRSRDPEDYPDRQVARDSNQISAGLLILGVIGLMGIVGAVLKGVATRRADPLLHILGVLAIVALVAMVLVWRRNASLSIAHVALTTLALVGGLLIAGAALALALVIFLFIICASGNGPRFL